MNRYAALGLMVDAGKDAAHVAVIVRTYHDVHPALREFEAVNEEWQLGAKVYRAKDAERVCFPSGGHIIFTTPRSNGLRGHALDVVFIDNDAHRVLADGPIGDADLTRLRRFQDDVAMALLTRRGKVVYS